jgi:hypothetical protein
MANHTCNQNCGCTNTYTVQAPCPPSCPEVFNAQCIVYTGTDILCGQDTVIKRYDYLDTVITKLVNYICAGLANTPVTVVESDSEYILVTSSTVGNTTTYVLDLDFAQLAADLNLQLPIYNVVGSDNVFVTTTTVGNTITFNLSALEAEVNNTDGLLNVIPNITPGVDVIYTVNVDLPALTAVLPQAAVISGPSNNSIIVATTVGNLTTYSIDSRESIVAAGDNVTVTATGGGAPNFDTTYTVDAEFVTLALLAGETVLDLTSAYNPTTHTTAYTLSTDLAVLNTIINTEINDVLDNTVSLFGIDAVYDNITQTLSIEFIGAAVDGVTITGDGTASNPLTATALAASLTNAGVGVGNESLVNDGTGPSLATKGIAGTVNTINEGVVLTSNATDIKIATTFNKWVQSSAVTTGSTVTVTHNLNTVALLVSVLEYDGALPTNLAYVHGTDYQYRIINANTIEIENTSGINWGPAQITVFG